MKCSNCGREISNKQRFCIACGQENLSFGNKEVVEPSEIIDNNAIKPKKDKNQNKALVGFILSLISLGIFALFFVVLFLLIAFMGDVHESGILIMIYVVLYGLYGGLASVGLAIPGIILSAKGRATAHKNTPLANAGLIMGIISLSGVVATIFFGIGLFNL